MVARLFSLHQLFLRSLSVPAKNEPSGPNAARTRRVSAFLLLLLSHQLTKATRLTPESERGLSLSTWFQRRGLNHEGSLQAGHGTKEWFQIRKGVCQGCTLSPCLFNLYTEYIMRNPGLDEAQAGIKFVGRKINNLRCADWRKFCVVFTHLLNWNQIKWCLPVRAFIPIWTKGGDGRGECSASSPAPAEWVWILTLTPTSGEASGKSLSTSVPCFIFLNKEGRMSYFRT